MSEASFPKVFRVRQKFAGPRVTDIAAEVFAQLSTLDLADRIQSGQTVAITAGSRGIANIDVVLRAIVDFFKQLGASPFIVPAMGSHGGATAEGQVAMLKTLGITPESCGCEIRASMETVQVCESPEGVEIHFDKNAYAADHVVVCGRIKLHTDFKGEIQSGLMKMLLIGLGKHRGAKIYHRAFKDYSFDQIAKSVSSTVIDRCRVAAGVAIVENGYEQTALIEAVRPEDFSKREPELLRLASDWIARIPFRRADVLVVDEIGKNISGTGMDTNVVGRKSNEHAALEDEWPKIKKIVVLGLTPETHGNATGIGVADLTTDQVVQSIDMHAMRVNCLTSGRTAVGMIPLSLPTDREAIFAALGTIGLTPPERAALIRIRNTLLLEEVVCSESYWKEANDRGDLEIVCEPKPMVFNEAGRLV